MVYITGAGTGSLKYISVYGLELIKNCDVLIYDRLIDDRLLDYAKKDCVKIYVGKSTDCHSMKQSEINKLIADMAKKYNKVVRLKGGDPFVFGRGGEEALECEKQNIPYELVPGITSAIAVPELCGIPVTHRGASQDLHIITGHTAEEDSMTYEQQNESLLSILREKSPRHQPRYYISPAMQGSCGTQQSEQGSDNINYEALAKMKGTLVFLMGVKNAGRIADKLIKGGMDKNTPVAFIENGGRSEQRVFRTSLEHSEECVIKNNIVPPSIIVIGKTAEMKLVCPKKKVGITGTESFKERLSKRLTDFETVDIGTLKIRKYDFDTDLNCEYIVLTSRNGVNIFMEYLRDKNIDIRRLGNIKFAVIGRGTYDALKEYGIYADIMPEKFTAEELSKALSECKGKKLILRAEKGSPDLYKYIDNYEDVKIYDVYGDKMKEADVDYVIFGSSSAVDNYCSKFDVKADIIAIGNVTAKRLEEYGYKPFVADEYSIDGIIRKLEVLENEKNETTENKPQYEGSCEGNTY